MPFAFVQPGLDNALTSIALAVPSCELELIAKDPPDSSPVLLH